MIYATIVNINGKDDWRLRIYAQGHFVHEIDLRRDNAWLLLKSLVEMLHDR